MTSLRLLWYDVSVTLCYGRLWSGPFPNYFIPYSDISDTTSKWPFLNYVNLTSFLGHDVSKPKSDHAERVPWYTHSKWRRRWQIGFNTYHFDSKWIQNLVGVHLKSLLHSDDIWRHWSWSTLAQVMARGLWLVAWRHNHSPDRTLFTQVPRHSISMKNASNITGKIASKYFISNSFSHGGNTTLFRG